MERGFKLLSSLVLSSTLLTTASIAAGGDGALDKVMKARGLSEADVIRAAKTYNPTGVHDKYYIFSSGGQSGQVLVYGVPSMRLLKYIAVFTQNHGKVMVLMRRAKKFLSKVKSEVKILLGAILTIQLFLKQMRKSMENGLSLTIKQIQD